MADEPNTEVDATGASLAVFIEAAEELLIYTTDLRETVNKGYAALNELTAALLEESSNLDLEYYGARGIAVLQEVFYEHEPPTRNVLDIGANYDNLGNVIRVVFTCQLNAKADALFNANEGLQNFQ